ncbi:MAG: phosphoenolpyruvate synthase, partial [Nanoarchaeota archaeon]|nr:phosphoenolpyruvate synthase [Nanoarchaeota archaeon]
NKFFKIKFKNNVLKGVASYHGLVKGFVKVVFKENDLSKIEKNDVLVMSMTFTNSVKVLTKVAAIITDEGGILSHAAIISREIKKPCIIGTKIATQVLKDGDFVEVDANKGIIKIIKRK